MVPARLTVLTIGARDLPSLREFYKAIGWPLIVDLDNFAAFQTSGAVFTLYALDNLVADTNAELPPAVPDSTVSYAGGRRARSDPPRPRVARRRSTRASPSATRSSPPSRARRSSRSTPTEDLAENDPERDIGYPGEYPVHPRRLPVDVPRAAVDDAPVRRLRHRRGDQRALPLPARPRADRALDRVRHAHPHGPRLRPPPLARRGRARGRRDRHARRHGDAVRRHPARRGDRLDDDQRAGRDPARALRLRGREAGRPARPARRHDPDRHPQGVHRPEGVVLPDRPGDADRHRHGRVLRPRAAALASDLDLRLPHPRGRLDRAAGARVHARRRLRLRAGGDRPRPRRRRLRAAPVVLLQRPHRLLRGDRQVPRRPPDLGARDARDLRRATPPRGGCASTPRPPASR